MTGSATVDVVVVGGGPAGAAAALWCARRGLQVVLLERERFPRHRPGETLPPGVEPLFDQLGVAGAIGRAEFARHAGTWVTWSGTRRFDAFGADEAGPWRGFQAPRDRLDGTLLDAAVEAGVEVRQPCRAVEPVLDAGRVVGVATGEGRIAAGWVVDAGGGRHWLARRLEIGIRRASPRLIARYGYGRGEGLELGDCPEIVADAAGWTWTARIAPGLFHWTRLSFDGRDADGTSPPAAFAGLEAVGRPRGADVSWRMVERPAGPGYICVGDAACVLDPAASHGVLKAIMSGMMAAHVIAEGMAGGASRGQAIQAYTDWLTRLFRADVTALTELYRTHPFPPAWVADGTT